MASDGKKLQPIIIKRVKKGGHSAHGGAWKIAYADFVTAMMAFFLLMWLLGSTTEGDKKGISDYFQSPLKVAFFGGSGAGDASSLVKGGGTSLSEAAGQTRKGSPETAAEEEKKARARQKAQIRAEQAVAEKSRLQALQQRMEEVLANSPKLAEYRDQIRLDMTRDGLRIQIVDDQARPMFDSGSALVKPYMRELLQAIGNVLGEVPNKLTLEGHTDSTPFGAGGRGYSNWELSADRANASRRELLAGGMADDKILRVQGLAASNLFDPADPSSPGNRRISIIVMNREAEDRVYKPAESTEAEVDAQDASLKASAGPPPVSSLPDSVR
jgi:chemotaxis protein MotB